jgi:UDP-glucose 4-epimerase
VDNLTTGRVENIASFLGDHRFRFDEADILTWGDLEKATIWADRIYHMAAVVGVFKVLEDPIRVLSINIAATERLLRMAATGQWKPQIVIASSSEIYGPTSSDLLREDDILYVRSGARSRWNYAISKLADEAFGLSYARQHDIPVCMARLFNTVGLRQTGRYGMVVPRFIDQALRDEPITIFGGGAQTRSFCDVRDTVAALALLASTPQASGEIVNVGNDREISINDLADLVCQRAGKNSVGRKHMSYAEAYGQQYDDILRRRPSLEKLRALTGFRHRWSLEDSLDEMIAHYRERQDK